MDCAGVRHRPHADRDTMDVLGHHTVGGSTRRDRLGGLRNGVHLPNDEAGSMFSLVVSQAPCPLLIGWTAVTAP